MKAWRIEEDFGLENLRLAEVPDPEPGPGEIVVALEAASLNYRDLMMVRGHYNPNQPLPLVPCSDGVGRVEALGPGVDPEDGAPPVGQRVAPIFAQGWLAGAPEKRHTRTTLGGPLDGTLAEKVVVRADAVVPVPVHLSAAQAACLPCAAVTAWHALHVGTAHGGQPVGPGDTVLTLGTGGVSIFALQLARLAGADVVVTSSSDAKLERARELGAKAGVNYRTHEDWEEKVLEATGGGGVDRVIEVGGAGTLPRSIRSVRPGGVIALIGVLSGTVDDLDIRPVLMRGVRIQGVFVGSKETFQSMNRAIAHHRLEPVVDRVVPFDDAPAAFEHLASGEHLGKVVVGIGD